jgi:hypothetical protein
MQYKCEKWQCNQGGKLHPVPVSYEGTVDIAELLRKRHPDLIVESELDIVPLSL